MPTMVARWISLLLVVVALAAGGSLWLQRTAAEALRSEVALLKEQKGELGKLQSENVRLKAGQIPAEERVRLQADHAAVLRLRTEIEQAKKRVETREEDQAVMAEQAAKAALTMMLEVGPEGALRLDGQGYDAALLRQRLAGLPKGSSFDVRLRQVKNEPKALMESKLNSPFLKEVQAMAKELGLKFTLQIDFVEQE